MTTPRHRIRRHRIPETGRHVWHLNVRRDGIMCAVRRWEHISTHPTWREAMADAAVYADAHVRLNQLELDIIRPEAAPHTRKQAIAWRRAMEATARTQALADLGATLRASGSALASAFAALGEAAGTLVETLTSAATSTQDDYALAGPVKGGAR